MESKLRNIYDDYVPRSLLDNGGQPDRLCTICGVREARFQTLAARCLPCKLRETEMWRRFFVGSKWERTDG